MRRFFVKNILFVIAVNVLVKPVWALFIDRTVQNRALTGTYGTYQALLSVSIIFQIILDFGITSYNTRTIAQNPDRLPALFPGMLSARLALLLAYMSLAFGAGWVAGYRGWELSLLVGVLLIQSLNSLAAFIRSNIAALQKFKIEGLLSVSDRLLMIVICGFLLLYPPTAHNFRIEWFVGAQIFCYAVAATAGYLILRRLAGVKLSFTLHGPTLLKIIKESLPYAALIFQMSIYNRADVTLMERICPDGKEQADIWSAAFRLMDQANMFGLMFATILLPMFGRMLAEKQNVQPIVKLCVNMLLPLSFMVAVAGIYFSADIMGLLYDKSSANPEYRQVFAILIASFPAWCLMYVYSTLLTAKGSLKTLNIIAFGGVVFNISLNLLLIPHHKAIGGAITSLATQSLLAVAFIIFAARIIKLPFNPRWIAAQLGYLVLVAGLAQGLTTVMKGAFWVTQLLTFGAICMAFMFVFRFVSVAAIKQLMNRGDN